MPSIRFQTLVVLSTLCSTLFLGGCGFGEAVGILPPRAQALPAKVNVTCSISPVTTPDEVKLWLTKETLGPDGARKPDVPASVETWLRAVLKQQKAIQSACGSPTKK